MALRKLAVGCEFESITSEVVLRDRLIFGIHNAKVRESFSMDSGLALQYRPNLLAADSIAEQMKC